MTPLSEDRFLDGRIVLRQPQRGFRAGLDAVLLAATVPARANSTVLELGSGVGTASLCLAARVPGCRITGLDVDPALVEIAKGNAALNGMSDRVIFDESDVFLLPHRWRKEFSHVFCNPPFHEEGKASLDRMRRLSKHDPLSLSRWVEIGLKRTAPRGTFTIILRADRLRDVLSLAPEDSACVFPLWPKPIEPAKRVIVQFRKGSRAQSVMLPGLVLHNDDGSFTKGADDILRGRAALEIDPRQAGTRS